jgi:hypothetical protein
MPLLLLLLPLLLDLVHVTRPLAVAVAMHVVA